MGTGRQKARYRGQLHTNFSCVLRQNHPCTDTILPLFLPCCSSFDIPKCEFPVIFTQFGLIADPYTAGIEIADTKKMTTLKLKWCIKCKTAITNAELHKIVIYVIEEQFTEHHYEHVECPDKFTI